MTDNSHRVAQVTLPGLSFKERQIAYIKCEAKIHLSERTTEDQDNRKPAHVMKITNLQDSMLYRMICPALMVSSFQDEGDDYVGKCFEIVVSKNIKPGKNYKEVQVYEIDGKKDYKDYPITIEDEKPDVKKS